MTLKADNPLALRLLMTDDLYYLNEKIGQIYPDDKSPSSILPLFDYQGENNKFILILINDKVNASMSPEDTETLTNILLAKKLELRDVAIINLHKYPSADFKQLKQFFSCSKLILFGVNPDKIALKDIGSNQIHLHEETRILATYSFDEMRNDVTKKRLFWNEMKKL